MHRLPSVALLLMLLSLAVFANGCAVYDVAVEERNVGTWADDKQITYQVEAAFLNDDKVKFLDFDASSYEGHVYIVGEYESRAQVDRAVQLAKDVGGVRKVTTYMLPKKEYDHCGTTDNVGLYSRLKADLVGDRDVWSTNVEIKTVQCNIILLGIVGSMHEREKIIDYAKKTKGVRGVKSYLKIKR